MEELSEHLKAELRKNCSMEQFILTILRESTIYAQSDINRIQNILERLQNQKDVERAKHKADVYKRQAESTGADFLFEAAVAGGIPIIRPLKQCLAANEIGEITGIVNGTTNYILTKMYEDGMDFDEALAKATELGYAEADPTAEDVYKRQILRRSRCILMTARAF